MKTPSELLRVAMKYDDPESLIAVYKEAAGYAKQMKEVQDAAKARLQLMMDELGEREVSTGAGKAAYTVPKTPKLDKRMWSAALARDPQLRVIQNQYDDAAQMLDEAQEPFKILPPGYLRIS